MTIEIDINGEYNKYAEEARYSELESLKGIVKYLENKAKKDDSQKLKLKAYRDELKFRTGKHNPQ